MARTLFLLCTFGAAVFVGAPGDLVALPEAIERLRTLESLLKRQAATNTEILAALDAAEDAYLRLEANPPAARRTQAGIKQATDLEKFRKDVERAYLKALELRRVARNSDHNDRHPVQFRAARALARARPALGADFMRALERVYKDPDYELVPHFYDVAFGALLEMNTPGTFEWLVDKPLNADVNPDAMHRALAAMDALRKTPSPTAKQRREAVRRILAIFQSYSFHWTDTYQVVAGFRGGPKKYQKIAGIMGPYWMQVRPTVIATLRHLSRDPRTGVPPVDLDDGSDLESIPRIKVWFGQNKTIGRPPWIDLKQPLLVRERTTPPYTQPAVTKLRRKYGIPWELWWEQNRDLHRPPELGEELRTELRKRTLPPLLIEALGDVDWRVRAAAAMTLGKLGAPGAVVHLRRQMEVDASEEVRQAAMLGLLLLRDPELRGFFVHTARARNENPRIRAYAVLAMGLILDADFFWKVFRPGKRVNDPLPVHRDLQACAVRALGWGAETGTAQALANLLGNKRVALEAQAAAGTTLALLRDPASLSEALKILRDARDDDPEQHVGHVSAALTATALTKPDDKRALGALAVKLRKSKARFGGVRNQVVVGLGGVGGSRAYETLQTGYERCLRDTKRYAERGYFLLALGESKDPRARVLLREQLESLDHERELGACALGLALNGDAATALAQILAGD
ncbi:MAG: HEAT repeat domain-containing protein [Planctomycetota bacterium]